MSTLHSVFYKFKEKSKVKNAIVFYLCLQTDIGIKNKENKLKTICYKHGICYQHSYGEQFWEMPTLTQIISI